MEKLIHTVFAFYFLTFMGCANFYDYKKVKNINPKRKVSAFHLDKKKCEKRAARLSRSAAAFILTDTGKGSRDKVYRECMKRRGWRLR